MRKLSIITINFNNANELKTTIESVLKQTFSDIEYIIIDGASTDNSVDLIQYYADNQNNSNDSQSFNNCINYWISEPDNGIYDALNKGIEQASGEWIMFLNSGDYLPSDTTLESIFKTNKTSRFDVLYGTVIIKKTDSLLEVEPSELCSFFYKMPFCHQSSLVKTDLIKIRKFDLQFQIAADYDFFCQLYRERKLFKKLNLSISIFTDGGISTINSVKMYKEFTEISYSRFKGNFRRCMYACYRFHVIDRKIKSWMRIIMKAHRIDERKILMD